MKKDFPQDYLEKLYAGILGKVIGVYLGHPTEGMNFRDILDKYGEVWYYLQERDVCEPDDDITGTYLFPRAVEDYPFSLDTLSENIAKVWLNGFVEHESAVAWSGKGISTEHTAYLNLKDGIMPPMSGSIDVNGPIVAQQVGGQIFMDLWGMLAPNDPDLAVQLVTKAVTVSHDGEALFGAQVLAAITAMAFGEKDMRKNVTEALNYIPKDSNIYKINSELLKIHAKEPDYQEAYKFIEENHSYAHYRGKCPMEPNHAIVILALLYGEGNFARSMMIVDTCGLDTDGNSANVAVIVGVANGVAEINSEADYILPMRGLVYVPYSEGGEAITDCENLTYRAYNMARKIHGFPELPRKKRFTFSLPYSLHGFELVKTNLNCPHVNFTDTSKRTLSEINGLEIDFRMMTKNRPVQAETLTLERYDKRDLPWYKLTASPTLYSGQVIEMEVSADCSDLEAALYVGMNAEKESYIIHQSEYTPIEAGKNTITFEVPPSDGRTIGKMGFIIRSAKSQTVSKGKVTVHSIDWSGRAKHSLIPQDPAIAKEGWWNVAWVGNKNLTDNLRIWLKQLRLAAHKEIAILSQGTHDFVDYTAEATIMPHTFKRGGIGVRCRGINRYLALLLTSEQKLQLVAKQDFDEVVLAETDCGFVFDEKLLNFKVRVEGDNISGEVEGVKLSATNPFPLLGKGGACLLVDDGGIMATKYEIY